MNTLPANRTLNTFNGNNARRSSISAIRYARSTSLYFPNTDTDEESRSQLLTSESIAETRRAETMNRLNRIDVKSEGSRNLTNPLFDSMSSIDQPWLRGYGQTVVLSPPKINLPIQQQNSHQSQQPSSMEHDTASTIQDMQHSIRLPTPRSPNIMHGGYGALPPLHYGTSIRDGYASSGGVGIGAGGVSSGIGRKKTKKKLSCLSCLHGTNKVESSTNCSADGWLYTDPRIRSICVTLWADWIPLYQRKFQCPDIPPGYADSIISSSGVSNIGNIGESNPNLKPLLERMNMLSKQQQTAVSSSSSYPTLTTPNPLSQLSQYQSKWNIYDVKRVNPEFWDGDLGLMIPPKLIIPSMEQQLYGPRDTVKHLYGRNYPTDKQFIQGIKNDHQWLQFSQSQTDLYHHMTISSIICFSEITFYFFNCCQMCLTKTNSKLWSTMKFIGQIYRLFIWLIKVSVGRLRPDFIQICRPSENVCPKWYRIIQKTRQSTDERSAIESDPQLLDLIVAQLAKQGKYLVTVATTPSPESSTGHLSDGLFTNADCMENNILKLKEARTSFPSLGAAVSMYAAIFVTVYITALMKNFRDACLCIPFLSLLGVSLIALILGVNRAIYRNNWFEDILAGWIIGICIAIYVCFKVLYNRDKWNDLTNYDLNRRLHRIQTLIQTHHDYKQSEVRLVIYIDMYFMLNYYTKIEIDF
ncbi:unnamed protein product [Schistosoma margrebowiei]|uniref:Phosphatidic acid phosphatase type 2/haloperoxidase domain-containing protein n=1 Tax=Schistosoma margrebowiei TaxID=48269 RepID=A0A183MEQ7_9TREM|nr:unnamed protein product [Schistosoma margrebowiei]